MTRCILLLVLGAGAAVPAGPARAQAPARQPGALFSSTWDTGTGTSPRALFDSASATPWDMHIGNGHLTEVVAADGLDFPTAHVLKVTAGYRNGRAASDVIRLHHRNERMPPLEPGGSRYYRWYIRVMVPDSYTGDLQTHPIQDGVSGGSSNWTFQVFAARGAWTLSWNVSGRRQNEWPNNRWICRTPLAKARTYRVELKLTRTGASTMSFEPRVYDTAGSLVCAAGDFLNANRSGSLAQRPTLTLHDPTWLQGFQVGFNGLDTARPDEFPMVLYYQGAICIRSDDWCGPYRADH